MKLKNKNIAFPIAVIILLASCKTLEKASSHGFNSGYYKFESRPDSVRDVYVDVTDDKIDVYHQAKKQPDKNALLTIPLTPPDSLMINPMVFKKNSLDVDLTSILLKYRPPVYGLPGQMITDLNIALYAGWRHDKYTLYSSMDPLGKRSPKMRSLGYDFGVFAGTGTTLVGPFTTQNKRTDEYNGMIIQTGIAGFLESNLASFGFAAGIDYLLNPDHSIWIYHKKPWVGFIVGIALN